MAKSRRAVANPLTSPTNAQSDFMSLLEDAERRDTERLSARSTAPSPRAGKPAPPTGSRPKSMPLVVMPDINLPTPGQD
eukprot:7383406-Prymnesium_polylepis.1